MSPSSLCQAAVHLPLIKFQVLKNFPVQSSEPPRFDRKMASDPIIKRKNRSPIQRSSSLTVIQSHSSFPKTRPGPSATLVPLLVTTRRWMIPLMHLRHQPMCLRRSSLPKKKCLRHQLKLEPDPAPLRRPLPSQMRFQHPPWRGACKQSTSSAWMNAPLALRQRSSCTSRPSTPTVVNQELPQEFLLHRRLHLRYSPPWLWRIVRHTALLPAKLRFRRLTPLKMRRKTL